jgi:hypothetical protein
MRLIFIFCVVLILFQGCKKEHAPKVDIYLLKSFTVTVNPATGPAPIISNAVLSDAPIVSDRDIKFYIRSATTFILTKDIKPIIKDYGPDKAFAVTIDNQPVYFGQFHPIYLSSIALGIATIEPAILSSKELEIRFATIAGNTSMQQLDKRNDNLIINAMKESGRLR